MNTFETSALHFVYTIQYAKRCSSAHNQNGDFMKVKCMESVVGCVLYTENALRQLHHFRRFNITLLLLLLLLACMCLAYIRTLMWSDIEQCFNSLAYQFLEVQCKYSETRAIWCHLTRPLKTISIGLNGRKTKRKKEVNFDVFYFINFCHEMIEHLMDQQESLACTNTHARTHKTSNNKHGEPKVLSNGWPVPLHNGFVLLLFSLNYFTLECVCVFPSFFALSHSRRRMKSLNSPKACLHFIIK